MFGIAELMVEKGMRPAMATHDCRMLGIYPTGREPLRSFVDRMASDFEARPGVLSVSLVHGFPWGDSPHVGTRTLAVTAGDAELAARQKAREEEAAMSPLERFEKLYATFEEEDQVEVITLADMFEMRRLSPSTEEDGKPWLLRWVTMSPNDCKIIVYADASEGDIHETIYLRGAQVVQVINGLPPGEGHMLRIVGASVWSKRREMRRERMEWHFAATDYATCFAWAKLIQANIDHADHARATGSRSSTILSGARRSSPRGRSHGVWP